MKIKKYLPIIGIAIFLYILLKLNISDVLKEISNANINFLLIAIFFVFISFIIQTLKWFAIAKVQMINIPFIEAFKIDLISNFYGFITPSRIGGVIRAEYLRKYNNNNLGKGVSNFVLDKVLDLCSLIFSNHLSLVNIAVMMLRLLEQYKSHHSLRESLRLHEQSW